MEHNVAALVRLMLVTDDELARGRDLIQVAVAAERGGISSFQLRLKQKSARELAELTRALVAAIRVPVLVNDRPDVALAAGAAGVHLGPDDLSVDLARRIAPPGFIIGASVGSETEAAKAAKADYWGIGPWRATATKGDAGAALGPDGFNRLTRLAGNRPCMAIGSIRPEDVPAVLSRGGSGVAVASGILAADDVEAATRQYAGQAGSYLRSGQAPPARAPDLSDGP
jgi:thiamine-phosphate pyrophosphorylase